MKKCNKEKTKGRLERLFAKRGSVEANSEFSSQFAKGGNVPDSGELHNISNHRLNYRKRDADKYGVVVYEPITDKVKEHNKTSYNKKTKEIIFSKVEFLDFLEKENYIDEKNRIIFFKDGGNTSQSMQEKHAKIICEKVPENYKKEFRIIKEETNDFTENTEVWEETYNRLYSLLEKKHPDVFVGSKSAEFKAGDIIDYENDYGKGSRSKIIDIESPNRIIIEQIKDGTKVKLNPNKVTITLVKETDMPSPKVRVFAFDDGSVDSGFLLHNASESPIYEKIKAISKIKINDKGMPIDFVKDHDYKNLIGEKIGGAKADKLTSKINAFKTALKFAKDDKKAALEKKNEAFEIAKKFAK